MSLALRIACDAGGCTSHLLVPGPVLGGVYAIHGEPLVQGARFALPDAWEIVVCGDITDTHFACSREHADRVYRALYNERHRLGATA